MFFVFDRVENIVGKREYAGYQHFFPFPAMFSKGLLLRVVKIRDCVIKSLVPLKKNSVYHNNFLLFLFVLGYYISERLL